MFRGLLMNDLRAFDFPHEASLLQCCKNGSCRFSVSSGKENPFYVHLKSLIKFFTLINKILFHAFKSNCLITKLATI